MNQPPPLVDYDLFSQNRPLVEALEREGGGYGRERAQALGEALGGAPLEWGRLANEHPPTLRTHDRYGNRADEVEFHPAWHSLMQLGIQAGLHALPWREPVPGSHVARAAMFVTWSQVEAGTGCPLSMTFASVPALRAEPKLAAKWEPRLTSLRYVDGGVERGGEGGGEEGALCGMAMTERQGGSDVRANTTAAHPTGDGDWLLSGHKWFCSAPMSDVFLVLAQAPGGLSCFLVPRRQDGFRIERLKDKLGNRSNASAEIELRAAQGALVGEEGRGVGTIIEMVNHTRLDCVLGSTGLQRRAVAEATHHAEHRVAFGRRLAEQPLMRSVLADLCIESEAATLTAMRLARAYDEGDNAFRRVATAVAKYWVCKVTPSVVGEALECLAGNGYVEESGLPRLFRESPLNSIWEGAGNVNCLDVLRALAKAPESLEAFVEEVRLADDPRLEVVLAEIELELEQVDEGRARYLVERLALALQASLLLRHGGPGVAEAFCVTRLERKGGRAFGTLPRGLELTKIVERHRPLALVAP